MIAPTDWIALAASLAALGGLVAMGEGLRRLGWSSTATRHLIHIGVGAFVASTPVWFTGPLPVAVLAVLFVGANGWAKARHWFPGMHAARPESWGTVAFPLAVLPALAATWAVAPDRIPAFQAAFLVLALADPAAAWVGERLRSRVLRPAPNRKTLAGTAVFAGGAAVGVGGVLGGAMDLSTPEAAAGAVATAGVAAAVEAVAGRGWDNFFIVQAVVLSVLAVDAAGGGIVLGAVIASSAFAAMALRLEALDPLGAAGGGLLAASLLVLGGWGWAVPALAFFVLSSALSRLPHRSLAAPAPATIPEATHPDSSGRTLRQVLANGGVAWLCLAVAFVLPAGAASPAPSLLYAAYVAAFATATADTWATEVGTRSRTRPVSLTTLRPVDAGTSGAVSLPGTLAGVAGAFCVGGLAALAADPRLDLHWAPVAVTGAAGMLLDSAVGATIQVRYRDPETGRVTETPTADGAIQVSGWTSVDNDAVNALATTAGALAGAGVQYVAGF